VASTFLAQDLAQQRHQNQNLHALPHRAAATGRPALLTFVMAGTYSAVGPYNFVPPFVWWLEKRYREKNYTITP